MFEMTSAWLLSLFVAIPILIYFMRSVTSKVITIPSLMLIEKIIKKHRLRQRSLWRLLLRMAIVVCITLAFMRPFLKIHKAERLPVYVDVSFSSSRYMAQIQAIITENTKNGAFSDVYYFTDTVQPLYASEIPFSYMMHDYSVLPEKNFYLISDFQTSYKGNGVKIPLGKATGNARVVNVSFSRSILRVSENCTVSAVLQSEKPSDILCSLWINGIKKLETPVHVNLAERVDFPLYFDSHGAYAMEVRINDDDYMSDNRYFAALHVYDTRFKYFINKPNYFLESLFEVIGGEKTTLRDADIVAILVESPNDVRLVQSLLPQQRGFVFAETSRISIPGTDVRIRDTLTPGVAVLSSKQKFYLNSSSFLDTEKGTVVARLFDKPVIVYSKGHYYFGFSPIPETTDLVVQPYFYSFMREKIFQTSLNMYELSTSQRIEIPANSDVMLNDKSVNSLVVDGFLYCSALNEPGIISVRSPSQTMYYAVNVHRDEYAVPVEEVTTFTISIKRVALFRWLILLATLLLILETYQVLAERRRVTL